VKRTSFTTSILGGVLFLSAQPALAAKSYDVTHDMTLKPNNAQTSWIAAWGYGQNVYAHNSLPQTDEKKPMGNIQPFVGTKTNSTAASVAGADAKSTVSGTVAFAVGQPFTATVTAKGSAIATKVDDLSSTAFSSARSVVGAATLKTGSNGQINWRSRMTVEASGGAYGHVRGKDPIDFVASDLVSGTTVSGTLLDIESNITGGSGLVDWTDGVLTISGRALSGNFLIDISSPYTRQQGNVQFSFANGIVTSSMATGMFSGLLPGVGNSAIGAFALGDTNLDYDFGFGSNDIGLNLGFGNGGEAQDAIPEPATWAFLIAGFGAVGGVMRRRRYTAA
jgi:hypothetical protein